MGTGLSRWTEATGIQRNIKTMQPGVVKVMVKGILREGTGLAEERDCGKLHILLDNATYSHKGFTLTRLSAIRIIFQRGSCGHPEDRGSRRRKRRNKGERPNSSREKPDKGG